MLALDVVTSPTRRNVVCVCRGQWSDLSCDGCNWALWLVDSAAVGFRRPLYARYEPKQSGHETNWLATVINRA